MVLELVLFGWFSFNAATALRSMVLCARECVWRRSLASNFMSAESFDLRALLDKHGNVIDGKHRLVADANWPKMRLDHVESEEDRLIAILISNVCRRNVSATEKSEILQELGEIYVKAGVKPGTELLAKFPRRQA